MLFSNVIFMAIASFFIGKINHRPKYIQLSHLSHTSPDPSDAALRFSASYTYTTSSILMQSQNRTQLSSSLHKFFQSEENRNHLLNGSGNIKVAKKSASNGITKTKFDALWKREATFFHKYGIEESSDYVQKVDLLITTPFLVFVIKASALLGAKITKDGECEEVFTDGKVHSPEYQFLLLMEDFEAEGPPPLVWIFNQLTGRYREKRIKRDTVDEPHIIHTYLRVWVSNSKSVQGDIKADRIVFKASCRAEIDIKFPMLFLQILAVAKEIIEKNGNRALQRSMERDVIPGVNEFREAFIQWERTQAGQ